LPNFGESHRNKAASIEPERVVLISVNKIVERKDLKETIYKLIRYNK